MGFTTDFRTEVFVTSPNLQTPPFMCVQKCHILITWTKTGVNSSLPQFISSHETLKISAQSVSSLERTRTPLIDFYLHISSDRGESRVAFLIDVIR